MFIDNRRPGEELRVRRAGLGAGAHSPDQHGGFTPLPADIGDPDVPRPVTRGGVRGVRTNPPFFAKIMFRICTFCLFLKFLCEDLCFHFVFKTID